MNNKTLLIVLGQGGHTEQMLRLVDMLGPEYNYEYVISETDNISKNKIRLKGPVYYIQNPREMTDKKFSKVFFKLFKTSIQSLKVLLKTKSKVIIVCGPAVSIPISILGRLLFRKRLIFIESWSRVYTKSLTGKCLAPISNITFVQWAEQKTNYPKAIFAGRLG